MGDDARLAGAGAGENQQRPFGVWTASCWEDLANQGTSCAGREQKSQKPEANPEKEGLFIGIAVFLLLIR